MTFLLTLQAAVAAQEKKWAGAESNCRHRDFQSKASALHRVKPRESSDDDPDPDASERIGFKRAGGALGKRPGAAPPARRPGLTGGAVAAQAGVPARRRRCAMRAGAAALAAVAVAGCDVSPPACRTPAHAALAGCYRELAEVAECGERPATASFLRLLADQHRAAESAAPEEAEDRAM